MTLQRDERIDGTRENTKLTCLKWTVGERRVEIVLKPNDKYCHRDKGLHSDQRGLWKMPPSYLASFTLLRNVSLDESIYMTDDGTMSGLAVASFGPGCLIYIGDDSLVMKEETAHIIINLCGGEAPWLEGQGSAYSYEKIKQQREERDLQQAIYEQERQERLKTTFEDFDHLRPDYAWNPDDVDRINELTSQGHYD